MRRVGIGLALAVLMTAAIYDMATGANAPPNVQDIRFFALDQLKG